MTTIGYRLRGTATEVTGERARGRIGSQNLAGGIEPPGRRDAGTPEDLVKYDKQ